MSEINHPSINSWPCPPEKTLEHLLSSMHLSALGVYDSEGTILYFYGDETEKRYGASLDKFCGKNLRDFYPPEIAEARIASISTVIKTGEPIRESFPVELSTGPVYFELTTVPCYCDGKKAFSFMRDITKQQQAMDELKESEQNLRNKNVALLELADAAAGQKDELGKQIQANLNAIVVPLLNDLMLSLPPGYQAQIETALKAVQGITSPFASALKDKCANFSVTEMKIAHLIATGMKTKDIAKLHHVSFRTINKQRGNIRHKLGLVGKDVNLVVYLVSLLKESPDED